MLDTGKNVNQKLKRLAGSSSASYETTNTSITALVRSDNSPNGFTPSTANTISDSTSSSPIYAWYDSANTTIYYYTEAATIAMNNDSSYFFHQMSALSNLSSISVWDTSRVTTTERMFMYSGNSSSSFNMDLSSWNTSSVTSMANMFANAGSNSATTWSVTIPKTNNGTTTGQIANTTSKLYGSTTSVSAGPRSGKSFTLAN